MKVRNLLAVAAALVLVAGCTEIPTADDSAAGTKPVYDGASAPADSTERTSGGFGSGS
jgi:hypothetical protein